MVSLNNRKDIIANSLGVITTNEILDVGDGLASAASALKTKADKVTVYTKTETHNKPEVNALINGLSDTTVAAQLELKADITDVNRLLALKADKADVYTSVDVDELLAKKANETYVDGKLELKADKNNTYTITETDDLLAPKATKAYVDAELKTQG